MTDSFIEGSLMVLRILGNLQLLHVKICSQIFENHGYVARLVIGSYMNCWL
jgi:hypothetical protein